MRFFFRVLATAVFVTAGIMHFKSAAFFRSIVPPVFPAPGALVAVSGIFEIVGGVGLLIPSLRRTAGWGLIALLVAVFPANIYMAVAPDRIPDLNIPQWILWIRLPLQVVLIWWVHQISHGDGPAVDSVIPLPHGGTPSESRT